MAGKTKIEWTDSNWNPIRGCSRVSEGCRNCYAENIAARFNKPGQWGEGLAEIVTRPDGAKEARWTGKMVQAPEATLTAPLRWKAPRMIFVNSTSDLFHEAVPDEWIDRVFAVMALCPQHTFQVLTKRTERMRAYFTGACAHRIGLSALRLTLEARYANIRSMVGEGIVLHRDPPRLAKWPLPNVWLGTSVEDQATADNRIPHLLATPAAIRFISAEPLLGPVDLSTWIPPASPWPLSSLPETWAEFEWPDWVPEKFRSQIESFWLEDWGRSPKAWAQSMLSNSAPPTGERCDVDLLGVGGPIVNGRFLFCWNNIGRVELEDGSWKACSFRRHHVPAINWVIVGGESGAAARPMHPDWARSLRDQCASANVPFFFKQHGKWLHESQDADGQWDWSDADDRGILHYWPSDPSMMTVSMPLSKKAAGRLLDGVTHDAMPGAGLMSSTTGGVA